MSAGAEEIQEYLEGLSTERLEVIFCHRMDEKNQMWNLERHSHDCLEAICFLEGELTIRQGERQMEAAASSVVLHPPHAAHQEFPMPGKRREVIALWIQGGGGPSPGESFQLVDREGSIRWLFEQIYQEYGKCSPASGRLIQCYLPALFLHLNRAWKEAGQGDILGRTVSYLQKNYHRPVTLQELARVASASPSYVERVFRRQMQTTPMGYLRALRIREACRLLVQSALSVEEIGLRVGFTDASYFWRSFRKETGYSPSAYRGRMRQRAESNTTRPGAFSD